MASVSVVILTANRRALLEETLGALHRGTRAPDQAVVVNNQSTDDTAEFLTAAKNRFSFELTPVDGPEGSFSECRNAGVGAATGDWIAFIDDDCEADPAWLERLLAALEKNQWVACGGAVLPASQLPSPDWYSPELAWTIGCNTPTYFGPLGGRLEIPTTSNLIFHRKLLDRFSFRVLSEEKKTLTWNYEFSREDAQFWRELRRAGEPAGIERRAIVWHHVPPDRIQRVRARERARQDGRGFWNREPIREEIAPAARDIVYAPIGALDDAFHRGIPFRQAWEARSAWARRQAALLEYAVDDFNRGISPEERLKRFLLAGAQAAASIAKAPSRRLLAGAFSSLRRVDPLPSSDTPPRRILAVVHHFLGDTVLAVSMLRQLAEAFPESDVFVLAGRGRRRMLEENLPANVEVLIPPASAVGRSPQAAWRLHEFLRPVMPDIVLLAYCHGLPPAPLFFLGNAPVIGWPEDNGLRALLYSDWLAARVPKAFDKAEAAALLDLLLPLGVQTRLERPRLQFSEQASQRRRDILAQAGIPDASYAVLHIEPANREKNWPPERMLAVADALHEKGLEIFLTGSRDAALATEEERAARPWCHSLLGLLDADELAGFLAGARLFVGADSGPAHLAQAAKTPAVILFGATESRRWGPLPKLPGESNLPWKTLIGGPGDWLAEETRGLPRNEAMRLLPLAQVLAAAEEVLRQSENSPKQEESH